MLALLRSTDGCTIKAVVKATGWQPHSVRGFFAGVVRKKLKLDLDSELVDDVRRYRITDPRERRAGLIRAIARSQQWLEEIVSGRSTIEQIAVRQKCSARQVNLTLSMAFLAPSLIKAAIEGRLPRGIDIAALRDAPLEWSKQYIKLGLPTLLL
ncbi:DUF3489 domain-containing protein [Nitrobacter sp.]|uniref:DUF3489 domain-containing protein n=1 Tax=Nitrobacter sp. TaxID=29420 RepID=UPI003F650CE1